MIDDIIDSNILFTTIALTISFFYITKAENKISNYYK